MPTLRQRDRRRPTLDECFALMLDEPCDMVRDFGSISAARAAWGAWRDLPELQPNPGTRPEAWWQFEPAVPEDLRFTAAFVAAHPELAIEAQDRGHRLGYANRDHAFGWSLLLDDARRHYLDERSRDHDPGLDDV